MGSSHQNVKQVALKLQEKGLILLERDVNDARVTRLVTTEKFREYWGKTVERGNRFTSLLFRNFDPKEFETARRFLQKLWANLDEMKGET